MDITDAFAFAYFLILTVAIFLLVKWLGGFGFWPSAIIGVVGGWAGLMLTAFLLANIPDWLRGGSDDDGEDEEQ